MEAKAISLGKTLAVPFVQELAKKPLTSVPPRYVHPDQVPLIISLDSCSPQVPVIDMQRLLSEGFMDTELQKLDQACREWGFFQLINHEMNSRLVGKVKLETEEFFKLPMEEKSKYVQQDGDVEGYGSMHVLSEDQKLHWGDRLYFTTSPPHLRKPHLFPNLAPSFRETLEAYSTGLINIKKDGMWIPVKPLPNAFIINIGDALEILSNGTYRSIEHRATITSPVEGGSILSPIAIPSLTKQQRTSMAHRHPVARHPSPSCRTNQQRTNSERAKPTIGRGPNACRCSATLKPCWQERERGILLGSTLAVPFVQELAKKQLISVPPCYVHPDQDPPIISLDSSSPQVPIIDMRKLLSQDFMDSEL
ncbi:hypothetical protein LWI28_011733 [Acer negundo]|uniref:Uncharacterized protein n=1 Tax=Acer negundo TaxID=4023 RepID=A0AAD5P562_ACENE|nr:hypothetical protein LWI28_011733 [Acer negundo]